MLTSSSKILVANQSDQLRRELRIEKRAIPECIP